MVNITETAAAKVKEVLTQQNLESGYLRLYVAGFGWGGPNFGMTLDESMKDNDILDEEHGIKILFEKTLASYLEGAVVDYADSQYGGGFQINTPSTGEGCGCS